MKKIYYALFLMFIIIAYSKHDQATAVQATPYETEHIGRFYCGGPEIDSPGIFRKFGYICLSNLENYDIFKIIGSLNNSKPVYKRAHEYKVNTNKYAAHVWVIDGYKSFNDITKMSPVF